MPRRAPVAVVGTALALVTGLGLTLAGCGSSSHHSAGGPSALAQCHHRWHDVGQTVVGLDEDTNPSGLADRWTSVIATIDYYEHTTTAKDCQADVENQVSAIETLRQFSAKVRPYDMAYQLGEVTAGADLYAHDPLPGPTKGPDGKLVKPPTKAAVAAALQTLSTSAAAANTDLAPGWGQLASVELTDPAAVAKALGDLDFLARDSAAWMRCDQALKTLQAALAAQDGS
ncbi:MAG: hypothetical protein ACJ72E_15085 [Marmoricola sp.]